VRNNHSGVAPAVGMKASAHQAKVTIHQKRKIPTTVLRSFFMDTSQRKYLMKNMICIMYEGHFFGLDRQK
jgi:hypothetical protein